MWKLIAVPFWDFFPPLLDSIEATISENVKPVFQYTLNYSKGSKCFDECIFNMQSAHNRILKDDIVIVINTTECTFFKYSEKVPNK